MSDVIEELKDADKEIISFYFFFEEICSLANHQILIDLSNQLYAGEISTIAYLVLIVIKFIIPPSIPLIIFGYLLHRFREKL
jgi:hypothetical protein